MKSMRKKTIIAAGIALLVYLALFLFIDKPVDLWIKNTCSDTWFYQAGIYISYLAAGAFIRLALAICFILIIAIDPGLKKPWTRNLLYVCVSCSVAVIIGEGLKYLLARERPVMFFEHNLYGLKFFSSEWALNSTPSGHTLRAFSILTALSLLYRRYTAIFITIAVLIGASRVVVTAHYPSDVVFGSFIGAFTAIWTYKYFFTNPDIIKE